MFAVPKREAHGLLAGRDTETARLARLVESLGRGRGAVLEIAGDPGAGKSRLLSLLAQLAERRGAQVVRACGTRWGVAPYQALRQAWGDRPDICPLPADPADDDSLERTVRSLLAQWASRDGGGVLLLDDFHLFDRESAALAAQLIRTPLAGPLVLAVAHRPRQTPAPLRDALECGARTGSVIRFDLEPLDRRAVAALLDGWRTDAGVPASPGAFAGGATASRTGAAWHHDPARYAESLHDACAGNPRDLRILVAAGWRPDGWPQVPGADRDGLLGEAAALTAELDALFPDAAAAAAAAAVLGDRFRPEDVAKVSGLGPRRTLDALAELGRADLVRPLAHGGQFTFRCRVLRHVVHEHAEPSFRLAAHRRAMELLAGRGASAAARARHAEHVLGMDAASALQVLAEGAMEVIAEEPGTAARWLNLALQCLPGAEGAEGADTGRPTRAALSIACCRALTAAGRLEEARRLAHELLGAASDLPLNLRMGAYAACADVERLLGRYDEAQAVALAALDQMPRPLPAHAAEPAFRYGLVHLLSGTYQQARALVREAASASADEAAHRQIRVLAACGEADLGFADTAACELTECSRLIDALPDAVLAGSPELLAMIGRSELYMERFPDAWRHLNRGLAVNAERAGQVVAAHHQMLLSALDQWTGRLDRAEHWARESERYARRAGRDDMAGHAMTMRAGALMWARGRRDAAEIVALAEHGAARGTGPCPDRRTGLATGMLAQIRLMNGDAPGCTRALLQGGGGEGLPLFEPPLRPWLLAMLAVAALDCGDVGAAHRWAMDADLAAEQLGLPVQQAYAHRARASLHAADGEHDAAAKLFAESAEVLRHAGMPVQHAWTLVTGARSASEALGPSTALDWLNSAVALSRGCGALRVRDDAARIQKDLAARGAVRAAGAAAGQEVMVLLTEREREIAKLAAAGKRSREIAVQLFLSPRTVEAHLSRIYRKLDISSRAALASCFLRAAPNDL
ncbi:helix-turn-helix transcriptional regulator [Wenjunlia tyrosinilytica]|nr:LuxR family transcriptional regulator [Wenjunlia tyrosinilytica]